MGKHPGAPRALEPSPEETTDLEELEQFAKTFKQRRIKLGIYKTIKLFISSETSTIINCVFLLFRVYAR